MYFNFFGLKEEPFTLSPNPKFIYYSKQHKAALSQLIYVIKKNQGYMVLTGEAGTGKTSIVNALLKHIPPNIIVGHIRYTALQTAGLFKEIFQQFGLVNGSVNFSPSDQIIKLEKFLKSSHNAGKKVVLLLDEAQHLSCTALEHIRLLTNFESTQDQYLQLILVGQTELDDKLTKSGMSNFNERIGFRSILHRLDRQETRNYINHRLRIAGCEITRDIFLHDAVSEIFNTSHGIPRRINILCNHALLYAYSKGIFCIDSNAIRDTIQQDPVFEKTLTESKDKSAEAYHPTQENIPRHQWGHSIESNNQNNAALYNKPYNNNQIDFAYQDIEKQMNKFLSEYQFTSEKKTIKYEKLNLFLLMTAVTMMGITLISLSENVTIRTVGIFIIFITLTAFLIMLKKVSK